RAPTALPGWGGAAPSVTAVGLAWPSLVSRGTPSPDVADVARRSAEGNAADDDRSDREEAEPTERRAQPDRGRAAVAPRVERGPAVEEAADVPVSRETI